MLIQILFLVLFFALMVTVGFYYRKKASSVDGFVLGSRGAGPWLTAFAFGTSYFSAVIFVGYAGQFGWNFGISSTWIGLGNAFIGSLLPWVILGRRTRIMTNHLGSKTMPEFYATLGEYDIIVNGVEMDQKGQHILTKSHLELLKTGCLIIDAAADADGAIEGTHYTSIGDPMCLENGVYYYCVNNVPSLIYRTTSRDISVAFAKAFYNQNIASFLRLIKK